MQELDAEDLATVRGGIFGLLGGLLANRPLLGGLLRGGLGSMGTGGAPMGGNPSAAAAAPSAGGPATGAAATQPTRASGGCGS